MGEIVKIKPFDDKKHLNSPTRSSARFGLELYWNGLPLLFLWLFISPIYRQRKNSICTLQLVSLNSNDEDNPYPKSEAVLYTVKGEIFVCRKISRKSGDLRKFPAPEYTWPLSTDSPDAAKFSCREIFLFYSNLMQKKVLVYNILDFRISPYLKLWLFISAGRRWNCKTHWTEKKKKKKKKWKTL